MTREELEMRKLVRESDVIDRTDGSELAKVFNHLWEKYVEREPLTDTEQRIFLAAMGREEKICREVCADGDGVDFVRVCREIKRKVKKALWELP